jgi:hypothetical protein
LAAYSMVGPTREIREDYHENVSLKNVVDPRRVGIQCDVRIAAITISVERAEAVVYSEQAAWFVQWLRSRVWATERTTG